MKGARDYALRYVRLDGTSAGEADPRLEDNAGEDLRLRRLKMVKSGGSGVHGGSRSSTGMASRARASAFSSSSASFWRSQLSPWGGPRLSAMNFARRSNRFRPERFGIDDATEGD